MVIFFSMGRVQSIAASRVALRLMVYSMIDVICTQQWLPDSNNQKMPWPRSDVTVQLCSRTQLPYVDGPFDCRQDPPPQQFENCAELPRAYTYDECCNDRLENLVIPLAIIQGLRHAVACRKKAVPLNLSQTNKTEGTPSKSEPSKKTGQLSQAMATQDANVVRNPSILHFNNEAGIADVKNMNVKIRQKYSRAVNAWEVDMANSTGDSNGMSSTCKDGPPCCLNAVDYIACMLSNLSNSTNATELEGKQLDVIRSFKREVIPSQSLSVHSNVNYEIGQEAENLRYSIGITVDGSHARPSPTYRLNRNRAAIVDDDYDAAVNTKLTNATVHNASDDKNGNGSLQLKAENTTRGPSRNMDELISNSTNGLAKKSSAGPGKHDRKLQPVSKSDLPAKKEAVHKKVEEATDEEYRKYNEWFSHTKDQPNQFCLAFPLMKSHCGEWVPSAKDRGSREIRREAVLEDEQCIKRGAAVGGLNSRGRLGNSQCAFVLCYLNGSYSENREYKTPKVNTYQPLPWAYCSDYDKTSGIPPPGVAPVFEHIPPSCYSRTTTFGRNEGCAGLYHGFCSKGSAVSKLRPLCMHSRSKCLQESNCILGRRLPNYHESSPTDCPLHCTAKCVENHPLRKKVPKFRQHRYSPSLQNCAVYCHPKQPLSQKMIDTHFRAPGTYYTQSCKKIKPWISNEANFHGGRLPTYHEYSPSGCSQWSSFNSPTNPPCGKLSWSGLHHYAPILQNCTVYSQPNEPLCRRVSNTQQRAFGAYCLKPWHDRRLLEHHESCRYPQPYTPNSFMNPDLCMRQPV